MTTVNRSGAAAVLMLLVSFARPAVAQENSPLDLTGTWRWINHEDERDRNPGAFPGDYRGLPLNDAARMRADTYDEEVDNAVAGLTSIIEPIMIVFMALMVGTIVIALFLPLVSIIQHLS